MATKASEPESQATPEVRRTSGRLPKLLLGGVPIVFLGALVAIIVANLARSGPDSAVVANLAPSGPGSGGTTSTEANAPAVGNRVGSRAPDFTLTNLEGKKVSLSQLQGKPVVVYFWSFT